MAIFSMFYLKFPLFPTLLEGGAVSNISEWLSTLSEQWKGPTHSLADLIYDTTRFNLQIQNMVLQRELHIFVPWQYVLSIISKAFTKAFTYDLKKSADRNKAFARSFIQGSHESVQVLRHEVMAYYFIT